MLVGRNSEMLNSAALRFEDGHTRRNLLAGAALAAGGFGVATLANPEQAWALGTQLEGFNNVKDYGAVGNGSGNDRDAIQACITASTNPDPSVPYAAVYIPPGEYPIGGNSLYLPDKSVIIGHGPLSILKATVSGTPHHIFTNQTPSIGNNDIRIQDVMLDGNRSGGRTATGELIRIYTTTNGEWCERILISGVELTGTIDPGFAILLGRVKEAVVENCFVHDCQRDGINLQNNCVDVVVQGNVVRDCGDDHIAVDPYLGDAPERISIVGNVCNYRSSPRSVARGSAIAVRGAKQVKIVGNVCRGGYRSGIELDTYDGAIQDVDIVGNLVTEAGNTLPEQEPDTGVGGGSGILVRASAPDNIVSRPLDRVCISGNVVTAPRFHGVRVLVDTSHQGASIGEVLVNDNQIWINRSAGYVTGSGSGVAVESPSSAAVRNVRVDGNSIRDARGPGIKVKGLSSTQPVRRCDLQNNRVIDSGSSASQQPGIQIENVDQFIVSGNRSQETRTSGQGQNNGLKLVNVVGTNLVTGNDFSGNTGAGISRTSVNAATRFFENLGDDAPVARHLSGTVTWDPPSIPDNGRNQTTVPVPDAAVGDTVAVGFSVAVPAGALLVGAVTAPNTVTVTLFNRTGGSINLGLGTVRADVWKH